MSNPKIAKKIVVITGASSGIGEATARLLSERGYLVFGGVRNLLRAPSIPGVHFEPLDVNDEQSVRDFTEAVLTRTGKIDVLINNAGVSLVGPIEKTSIAEAKLVFETNLFGPLRMVRAILPSMRQARSGLVINTSSVLGFLPAPFMGIYASSKHALEGLSESLDHEVREYGVRVVLLEPSFTNTRLDTSAATTEAPPGDYARQVEATAKALSSQIKSAPPPSEVAGKIASVIEGTYRMRQPADGRASLLSRLRRFMPAAAVDRSLRKTFGFSA